MEMSISLTFTPPLSQRLTRDAKGWFVQDLQTIPTPTHTLEPSLDFVSLQFPIKTKTIPLIEKEVKMTREEKIAFLIECDIKTIKEDLDNRDFEYLTAILTGDGWTQYSFMSDEMIDQEYKCQSDTIEDSPMDKLFPDISNKLKKLTLFDFIE